MFEIFLVTQNILKEVGSQHSRLTTTLVVVLLFCLRGCCKCDQLPRWEGLQNIARCKATGCLSRKQDKIYLFIALRVNKDFECRIGAKINVEV